MLPVIPVSGQTDCPGRLLRLESGRSLPDKHLRFPVGKPGKADFPGGGLTGDGERELNAVPHPDVGARLRLYVAVVGDGGIQLQFVLPTIHAQEEQCTEILLPLPDQMPLAGIPFAQRNDLRGTIQQKIRFPPVTSVVRGNPPRHPQRQIERARKRRTRQFIRYFNPIETHFGVNQPLDGELLLRFCGQPDSLLRRSEGKSFL